MDQLNTVRDKAHFATTVNSPLYKEEEGEGRGWQSATTSLDATPLKRQRGPIHPSSNPYLIMTMLGSFFMKLVKCL